MEALTLLANHVVFPQSNLERIIFTGDALSISLTRHLEHISFVNQCIHGVLSLCSSAFVNQDF